MTDVNDLVEAFKREVAIPGRFAEDFPTVKDSHIAGLLAESSNVRYKAGPVEMEQSKYSNVITTVYKSLQERLDRILQQANSGAVVPFVLDGYSGRGAAASYGACS